MLCFKCDTSREMSSPAVGRTLDGDGQSIGGRGSVTACAEDADWPTSESAGRRGLGSVVVDLGDDGDEDAKILFAEGYDPSLRAGFRGSKLARGKARRRIAALPAGAADCSRHAYQEAKPHWLAVWTRSGAWLSELVQAHRPLILQGKWNRIDRLLGSSNRPKPARREKFPRPGLCRKKGGCAGRRVGKAFQPASVR